MAKEEDWERQKALLLKDIESFDIGKVRQAAAEDALQPARQGPQFPTLDGDLKGRPATPSSPARPAASGNAPAAPPPATTSGLLEKLRQQAQEKQNNEEEKTVRLGTQAQRISNALGETFLYFRDLCNQLNILKPAFPHSYKFFDLADFDQLVWQEGRADFRKQESTTEERLYDNVTLRYRLTGPQKFRIERENPALEKVRKALFDYNIPFTIDEIKNERGYLERAVFDFPSEVRAGLVLSADYAIGEMRLKIRNIQRFGGTDYRLQPEDLTHEALDEITKMILGEPSRFAQMFRPAL